MPKNTAAAEAEVKRRSMFQESMHRLVQNKLAMTGLFILVIITVLCLCAGIICPEGYDHQDVLNKFVGPCRDYPFGTDSLGRRMLARILYGGRVDNIIMRTLDIFSAIPNMLMAIAVSSALGGGLINCIIAIAISGTPQIARTVRAPILAVKEQEYVEAAREIDASDARIIFRHVLPNVLSPLIVTLTSQVAASSLVATALSVLGLGIQPPEPEWGALISNSRQYIREYPFLVTFPGLAIALTVLSMNLFGDGLRDALDPKLKN